MDLLWWYKTRRRDDALALGSAGWNGGRAYVYEWMACRRSGGLGSGGVKAVGVLFWIGGSVGGFFGYGDDLRKGL